MINDLLNLNFSRIRHLFQLGYTPDLVITPFNLPQPTNLSELKKYHALGNQIISLFPQSALNAKFNGAHGVKLISDDNHVTSILEEAKSFREGDLSIYVSPEAKLSLNTSATIPRSTEENIGEDSKNKDAVSSLPSQLTTSSEDTSKQLLKNEIENLVAHIDFEYANKPGDDVDAVVKRRIGQGLFRDLLEHEFGSVCCICGLTNKKLLIASHIIPWSKATRSQKTDSDNGLLLTVTWDALFDKGFISFSDDGALLCSEKLDQETIRCLGISIDQRLGTNLLSEKRKENLAWHRKWFGFD